jgi:hypothetical protein
MPLARKSRNRAAALTRNSLGGELRRILSHQRVEAARAELRCCEKAIYDVRETEKRELSCGDKRESERS